MSEPSGFELAYLDHARTRRAHLAARPVAVRADSIALGYLIQNGLRLPAAGLGKGEPLRAAFGYVVKIHAPDRECAAAVCAWHRLRRDYSLLVSRVVNNESRLRLGLKLLRLPACVVTMILGPVLPEFTRATSVAETPALDLAPAFLTLALQRHPTRSLRHWLYAGIIPVKPCRRGVI